MMNSTMYNGGNYPPPQSYLNNSVITKALAQNKVKKYRAQIKIHNSSASGEDQLNTSSLGLENMMLNQT